jgi:hypothetical protein
MTSLDSATAAGVIICGAAGNNYQKIDVPGGIDYNNWYDHEDYGDNYSYYHRGMAPTAANTCITVGAIGQNGSWTTEWSNKGPRVDVFAAGDLVMSAYSKDSYYTSAVADPRKAGYYLQKLSGTSMASPQVVGYLACVLQTRPKMTQTEAKAFLKAYGTSTMYNPDSAVRALGDFGRYVGYTYNEYYRMHSNNAIALSMPFNSDNRGTAGTSFPPIVSNTMAQTYSVPGYYTYTVPTNVDFIRLFAWGAGGGAIGGHLSSNVGGGGGYLSITEFSNILVKPYQTIYMYVGQGGTGGDASATDGEPSWVNIFSNTIPTNSGEGILAMGGNGAPRSYFDTTLGTQWRPAGSIGANIIAPGLPGYSSGTYNSGGAHSGSVQGLGPQTNYSTGNIFLSGQNSNNAGTGGGAGGYSGYGATYGGAGGVALYNGGDGQSRWEGGSGGGGSFYYRGGNGGWPGGGGGSGYSITSITNPGGSNSNTHGFGGDGGDGAILIQPNAVGFGYTG